MFVYPLSFWKSLHTDPTYMGLTSNTGHVVATVAFLDRGFTPWAIFDVVKLGPLLEKFFPAVLTVRTFLTVMVFDVTTWADANQARRAL